jgi:hypothetical protein
LYILRDTDLIIKRVSQKLKIKYMKVQLLLILISGSLTCGYAQQKRDSICTYKAVYDKDGMLLPWYKPEIPGAGYDKVINLASDFIKNGCPVEPTTNLKLYMVHTYFLTPREVGRAAFDKGLSGSDDGLTPACTFANFVKSFVLLYFPYSGDSSYIGIVRQCLDRLIDHGTTPAGWVWAKCPYASANPRSTEYFGATHWGVGGRNDGPFVIEPDKVGETGIEYLHFYEVTGEKKYLDAAIDCADALSKNVRKPDRKDYAKEPLHSPWPFRVSAENGQVHEEYSSNVIEAIKLFDELTRVKDRIGLDNERITLYIKTRETAWRWLFSTEGPMRTFVWNGYFEDIPSDRFNKNRVQYTPLETARYLIKNPELDPDFEIHVPALIYWVLTAFKDPEMDAMREQFWCYASMGSHTARFASICALWYERTKNEWFKDQAYRYFNWATYECDNNGYVIVGPDFVKQYWFSDGYGDYVRHFIEGLGAIPEWAPAGENHLLRSSSVVRHISYSQKGITYNTLDNQSEAVFRLTSKPKKITASGQIIDETKKLSGNSWTWQPLNKGGVLRLNYTSGNKINIDL